MDPKLNEDIGNFPAGSEPGPAQGPFYAFFKKFAKKDKTSVGRPKANPKQGDAVTKDDPISVGANLTGSRSWTRHTILDQPPVERKRRDRYRSFDSMDDFPEISSAFDIYADDSTQEDIDGKMFTIKTDDQIIKDEFNQFVKTTKLGYFIWDISRSMVKYGDCFIEPVLDLDDPEQGIQRIKILNPNFMFRIEDKYGNLQEYIQQIPTEASQMNPTTSESSDRMIKLHKEQIIHFRRRTSDSNFYPYGKGVASSAIRTWRSLRLMEDAMIIYRLSRAPERRVFKVECYNLPASKIDAYMEKVKSNYKKEKFYDHNTGSINEKYNPMTLDEDYFIPIKNGKGADIVPLPGAQNLGDIDDVRYWRDKVLAAMKVPKDFIVEKDKSPERKANLSQLDVKFSKAVARVQKDLQLGLLELFRRHMLLKGFPFYMMNDVEIILCPPSDMSQKRRLEIDEQKLRVIQALQGLQLFAPEYIYKTYFGLTDGEILEVKAQLKKSNDEQGINSQGNLGAAGGMPGMGGPPGMGGMPGQEGMMPGAEGGMPPPGGAPPQMNAGQQLAGNAAAGGGQV